MKQFIFAILLLVPFHGAMSAGGGDVHLDHVDIDLEDKASLQEGAKLFVNYCMGCHASSYSRYNRVARDLGIPDELMKEHLIFGDEKVGELMTISMNVKDGKEWFGAPPPDLTLVARVRGADWLYTYLRTFYEDPSRPWGVNNKVFKDVGMPHALLELQGIQREACKQMPAHNDDGSLKIDPLSGQAITKERCDVLVPVEGTGTMTPEEYDEAIEDLVNFMVYNAEPVALTRQKIGVFVLFFLALLFIPVYLLNREYWKDVH